MRRLLALLVVVGALAASRPAAAEPLEQIFADVNRAYFSGDYERAAAGYQRLVEAEVADADVYYNLGLAQAHRDALGRSILAFERALSIRPADDDAARALERVRASLGEQRAAREGEATTHQSRNLLSALGSLFPEPVLAYALLAFTVLAFACLAWLHRERREAARIGVGVGAGVAFLFVVLSGLALLGRREATEPGVSAIVLDDHVMLREGPDPSAQAAGELREGERVRVVTRHGVYYELLLTGGERGWAPSTAVGVISPHSLQP